MGSQNSDTGYTVERLNSGNLADVAKLHAAVYNKNPPEDLFVKKYATAYTGKQYTGFIAYNNDRVAVGYYGVIPCFLYDKGTVLLAAQSADTMTHPGYRYKGLFVELSNMTFDLCRVEGIRIIFGFPNQNSLHGAINKLGWKMIDTMDCFTIRVNSVPLEKISAKFSWISPLYAAYKRMVLGRYAHSPKTIPNSVIIDGYSGVYHDPGYMNYKTYHESRVIRIGQSLVWIKINNGLIIGDIHLAPGDFEQLMAGIKKLAIKLGLGQIQFHTSPGTSLHALFAKQYPAAASFPALFQDLDSGLALNNFKFTFSDIDIF